MPKTDAGFHDFIVHDLLHETPGIHSRRMFGGWGIYKERSFFAIITDGELYLKADAELAKEFKEKGSNQFTYSRGEKGKPKKRVALSYWSVPENILENREEFLDWVDKALRVR